MTIARLGTVLALAIALPTGGGAQLIAGPGGPIQQADALYFGGSPLEALEILEHHLDVNPMNYGALWRAARSALVLGIAADEKDAQNRWLDPAIDFGERAVAVHPAGIDGIYWRGAAAGRRALNAGAGHATELAQRVYDDAHAILSADPTHGGAHNLLGKLNYEVMSLSRIERALGRLFMGNDAISQTSWEKAETHLLEATESWPELILFRFDLAQLYKKRGREAEAVQALQALILLPPVHPPDREIKDAARMLLAEIDGP